MLVKWKEIAEPNWEERVDIEEAEALDVFKKKFVKGDRIGESERARQGPKQQKIFKKKSKLKILS